MTAARVYVFIVCGGNKRGAYGKNGSPVHHALRTNGHTPAIHAPSELTVASQNERHSSRNTIASAAGIIKAGYFDPPAAPARNPASMAHRMERSAIPRAAARTASVV